MDDLRKSAKPNPAEHATPAQPTAPPPDPTVNDLVNAAAVRDDAAVVQRAQEYLAPFIEHAKRNLVLYRRLAEETTDLRRRTAAVSTARLGMLGCPLSLLETFAAAATPVLDIPAVINTVEHTVAAIGRLAPRQCVLPAGMEARPGQWPATVRYYRDALSAVGEGEDRHRPRIEYLEEQLGHVETWTRNYAAAPRPTRPPVRERSPEDAPAEPVSQHFNPFEFPKR